MGRNLNALRWDGRPGHYDLALSGTVRIGERTLAPEGARGGQAHIWGSRHGSRWAWTHCNDLETVDGRPQADGYLDGVSVFVRRFGRELGPTSPVVGRIGGRQFRSTNPDPDGERAYCHNSEVASLRCRVHERHRSSPTGWGLAETLVAPARAHFEDVQREPVPGLALTVT